MPRLGLPIEEYQQNKQIGVDTYVYLGYNKKSGLHMFVARCDMHDHRQVKQFARCKVEMFAKRKDAHAGWHLRRGDWCYEFVRSIYPFYDAVTKRILTGD